MKKTIFAICVFLSLAGFTCFLAPAIFIGHHEAFPDSFEWPVGHADNVISTQSGLRIVPHIPSGRIQIYNSDWRFVRGWNVDALGGTFKVMPFDENKEQIDIVTARGNWKYTFDINGKLLLKQSYLPATYNSFPKAGISAVVPTSIWLLPLTNPFIAWGMTAIGVIWFSLMRRGLLGFRLGDKTRL